MDPAYAAAYRELYERHWWWRAREKFLLARLARHDDDRVDRRILDVGCGDALFFDELSQFGCVEGLETDETILGDGPWRPSIHVGTLDASFAEGRSYDWVLMLDVLEHVPDAPGFLAAARALLAEGGRLFITVPAFDALWTSHDEINEHVKRYTKRSLTSELASVGLQPIRLEYFFHWIVPLKLLVRLKEAVLRSAGGPPSVPPAPLNRLAYAVSRIEQSIPGRQHLPFGTSLYACCEEEGGGS